MQNLLSLPNYINGHFRVSDDKKILKDYKGNDFAIIYNTSNSDLRLIKRDVYSVSDDLKKIDLKKIINIVKSSMDYYYKSEDSFVNISKLTGSPHNYVKMAVKELKEWASNIDEYIKMCFNNPDYDSVPLFYKGKVIAY